MSEADAVAELLFIAACAVAGFFAGTYGTRALLSKVLKGWVFILLRPNKSAKVFTLGADNESKNDKQNDQN